MSSAAPATGGATRKSWNKDEWEAKAKAKDEQYAEQGKAAEEAMKQGKRPRYHPSDDLPKPTKNLEARTEDLGIEKNLNKTVLVTTATTGKGPRGAGFYCDLCNRTLKDSLSYLDHVNGRGHLRMIGQTTQVARSTLAQVRAKIASLRASTAQAVTAKTYDFNARLAAVREADQSERQRRKEERKRKRAERREDEEMQRKGVIKRVREEPVSGAGGGGTEKEKRKRTGRREREREEKAERAVQEAVKEREEMADMMGFGGFGGGKKR